MANRQIDIGIITIIQEEFRAVLRELGDPIETVSGRREYNLYQVEGYDVAVVRCLKQGNAEAQSVARDIIADLAPQWLLLVGIAGGAASNDFTLGDVIVSSHVYDFSVEAALQGGVREFSLDGGPLHRAAGGKVANLEAREKELAGWNATERLGIERPAVTWTDDVLDGADGVRAKVRRTLEYHFGGDPRPPLFKAGHVASSDRLLRDPEILPVWQRCARHITAIEMESAGVAKAAFGHDLPFVAIRGISDIVGLHRTSDWKEYASRTAAAFARAFLRTRPCEPRRHAGGPARTSPSGLHGIELADAGPSLPGSAVNDSAPDLHAPVPHESAAVTDEHTAETKKPVRAESSNGTSRAASGNPRAPTLDALEALARLRLAPESPPTVRPPQRTVWFVAVPIVAVLAGTFWYWVWPSLKPTSQKRPAVPAARFKNPQETDCQRGDAEDCVARAYDLWEEPDKDIAGALSLYDRACTLREASACFRVGAAYRDAKEVHQDLDQARRAFEKGCDLGYGLSCSALGRFASGGYGGMEKSSVVAAELYSKACDLSSCWGCADYGHALRTGTGVPKDPVLARTKYQIACDELECDETGDYGCAALGDMYRTGEGGEPERDLALKYYAKSCSLTSWGNEDGCRKLATIYWNGEMGIQKHPREAVRYLSQGCDKQQSKALCNRAAKIYWYGFGVPQDREKAISLRTTSCDLGDTESCRAVSLIHLTGVGVDPAPEEAQELWRDAHHQDMKRCELAVLDENRDISGDDWSACRRAQIAAFWEGDPFWSAEDIDEARFTRNMERLCSLGSESACQWLYAAYRSGVMPTPDDWQQGAALGRVVAGMERACSNENVYPCLSLAVMKRNAGELDPRAFLERVHEIRVNAKAHCQATSDKCEDRLYDVDPWGEQSENVKADWVRQALDCARSATSCVHLGVKNDQRLSHRQLTRSIEQWKRSCAGAAEQEPLSQGWQDAHQDCLRAANALPVIRGYAAPVWSEVLSLREAACAGGLGCDSYARLLDSTLSTDAQRRRRLSSQLESECFWELNLRACAQVVDEARLAPKQNEVAAMLVSGQCSSASEHYYGCLGFLKGSLREGLGLSLPELRYHKAACDSGGWEGCLIAAEAPHAAPSDEGDAIRAASRETADSLLEWHCLHGVESSCSTLAWQRLSVVSEPTVIHRWQAELRRVCLSGLFDGGVPPAEEDACISDWLSRAGSIGTTLETQ